MQAGRPARQNGMGRCTSAGSNPALAPAMRATCASTSVAAIVDHMHIVSQAVPEDAVVPAGG